MLKIDQTLYNFLVDSRSTLGTAIFSIGSFLGNWQFIVLAMIVIITFLILQKKLKFIAPLLLAVLSSEAITFLGKWYFQRPRPVSSVFWETGWSFPSSHATIAVAFYGFLAFILLQLKPRFKTSLVYTILFLVIVLIGFSRLYLGAHYLSDVLVGYLVGIFGLSLGVVWTGKRV